MESILNNSLATFAAYVGIISIYLFVIPLTLFYWMNNRWNVMAKFERLIVYGLVSVSYTHLTLPTKRIV